MARNPSDDFDDEELIRAEFDSMVEGLSLDESTPNTYLDDLENAVDENYYLPPKLPRQSPRDFFISMKEALERWFYRGGPRDDDDGAHL